MSLNLFATLNHLSFEPKKTFKKCVGPIGLVLLISLLSTNIFAQKNKLNEIESPIIFKGNDSFAYGDPAVLYHKKIFYLFFTLVKSELDSKVYSYTAMSTSKGLRRWSETKILTPRD